MKSEVEVNQTRGLFEIVAQNLGLSDSTLRKRGTGILESEEGRLARRSAKHAIQDYRKQIARIKSVFLRSRYRMTIEMPTDVQCIGGGYSERSYYLANGSVISNKYDGSLRCTADIELKFEKIPAVEQYQDGSFHLGTDAMEVMVDRHEIKQIPFQTISFKDLEIEADHFSLKSRRSGKLIRTGKSIQILFN